MKPVPYPVYLCVIQNDADYVLLERTVVRDGPIVSGAMRTVTIKDGDCTFDTTPESLHLTRREAVEAALRESQESIATSERLIKDEQDTIEMYKEDLVHLQAMLEGL